MCATPSSSITTPRAAVRRSTSNGRLFCLVHNIEKRTHAGYTAQTRSWESSARSRRAFARSAISIHLRILTRCCCATRRLSMEPAEVSSEVSALAPSGGRKTATPPIERPIEQVATSRTEVRRVAELFQRAAAIWQSRPTHRGLSRAREIPSRRAESSARRGHQTLRSKA